MSGEQHVGLYRKFKVERTDGSSGPGGKHEHCRYFALDLIHDPFARPAVLAYAKSCEKSHPVLAEDLREISVHMGFFKGGRTPVGLRCIGPGTGSGAGRCGKRYSGQKGWDFVCIRPLEGWVCGDCRGRFIDAFAGPGMEKPLKITRTKKGTRILWPEKKGK